MSELTALTGSQAIDALAAGQVSAIELTQACLSRISELDRELGAFVHVDTAAALKAAHASDQRRASGTAYHPLDGIPCAVSDNIAVADLPLGAGMATRRRRFAQEDAHCIGKLRRAGAVFLGKLAINEAGFGFDGDNPHLGRCRNPHGATALTGGAASGAAAALAAGLCPITIGVDSLGSMRVPAAWCGVAAFMPTHARVSQRGLITLSQRLDQAGPMARSVGDLAVVFQQMSGVDALDPQSRTVPLHHIEHRMRQLRVGVVGDLSACGVEASVITAFDQAVGRLAGMLPTQHVVTFNDYDFARKRLAARLLCAAELQYTHADDLATQPENFSPSLREAFAFAAEANAVRLIEAEYRLDLARLKARRLFASIDVLLLPTVPIEAPTYGSPLPDSIGDLTCFANFAGLPALTLYLGHGSGGLPLGLQLIGARGSDLQLLALGEHIESLLGVAPAAALRSR